MAVEYAGYIPTQKINWAKLSDDLAGKVYKIGEERQKKREELDQIATDNQAMLNAWQPGKNQTFNQAVLRGADQARVLIKQWNDQLKRGEISPVDYKNKMNNMKEYWGILAQTAKTYDDRYLEVIKRQTPDENGKIQASSFEIDMLDDLAQMSDLSKSATQWDNDGRLYMANTDPNNGQILGDIYDVRTVNLPDNIIANRVYVDESVNGIVKNWEPKVIFKDLGKGGELNIESVKEQDEYKIMVENVVNTIAPDNNPRAQISVLADNGVITPFYYKTDEEYKTKKEQQINRLKQLKIDAGAKDTEVTKEELDKIELSLVRKVQDRNGLFMPVLTEDQKNAAKKRVRDSAGIQLAEKITGTPQQKWTPSGGGDGTPNEPKPVQTTKYGMIAEAWKEGDRDTLNSLLVGNYEVRGSSDGTSLAIFEKNKKGEYIQKSKYTKDPAELKQFFYGNTPNQLNKADKEIVEWRQSNYSNTQSTKPKMTPAQWNAAWSKLKKGQTMVGLDGITYTKQ